MIIDINIKKYKVFNFVFKNVSSFFFKAANFIGQLVLALIVVRRLMEEQLNCFLIVFCIRVA